MTPLYLSRIKLPHDICMIRYRQMSYIMFRYKTNPLVLAIFEDPMQDELDLNP